MRVKILGASVLFGFLLSGGRGGGIGLGGTWREGQQKQDGYVGHTPNIHTAHIHLKCVVVNTHPKTTTLS